MPSEGWIRWTTEELRVLDRCVRGIRQGRYEAVSEAARAFLQDVERLKVHGDVPAGVPTRNYLTVHGAIRRRLGSRRRGALHSRWKPDELAVLNRYVGALMEGRYATVYEAADACHAEFERLRRGRAWATTPRNLVAIRARLYARAHAAGHVRWPYRIIPTEQAVFDRYARALADRRYRDLACAAQDCLKDLGRLRRMSATGGRSPSRTLSAVRLQLSSRARKLGWSWVASRWRPEERQVLDRHVRALAGSVHPSLKQIARDCYDELEALYRRRWAKAPALRQAYRPRTYRTIHSYLLRWSREKGRTVSAEWTPQEDQVAARYARALIEAGFADAPTAAQACEQELRELRLQWRANDPARFRGTRPRSAAATYHHLCKLAHKLNQRWPKTGWTQEEMRACERWIRWYERHRGVRRLRPWDTAAEGLQEELERLNSRRSVPACRAKFCKEWRRLQEARSA
jgi:hypothetical protein